MMKLEVINTWAKKFGVKSLIIPKINTDKYFIKASDNLSDLTGEGTEFWTTKDKNFVRLEFFNGNIVRSKPSGNTEDTVISPPVCKMTTSSCVRGYCDCDEVLSFEITEALRELKLEVNNVIRVDFKGKKRI